MRTATYTIDQICEMTGIPRRTVRYYVQIGLLESPVGRGRGGNYLESHLERLRRIKSLQEQGLALSSIEAQLKAESAPSPADLLEVPASEESRTLLPNLYDLLPQGQSASPSPALPVPNLCRTVRSTYRIAPGVELVVDRETEEARFRKIQQVVRIASTILSEKE